MAVKELIRKETAHQDIGALAYWQNICYFCAMETLIVQPKTKEQLAAIKAFLKELNVPFKTGAKVPNEDTLAAMAELKAGKGKRFKDVETLFKSI